MRVFSWDRMRVKKRAARDAILGIPPENYDGKEGRISFTEQELINAGSSDINLLVQKWKSKENVIMRDLDTLVPSMKGVINQYDTKLTEYQKKFGKEAGPDTKHHHTTGIWIFIFICFIIEASLNAAAFRMMRDSIFNTWIIALSISISMTFLADYWGRLLKNKDKELFEKIFTIAIPIIAIVIAYFIGSARTNAAISRGIDRSAVKLSFSLFMIINLLAFLITTITSYKSSPSYPKLQKLYLECRRRKHQFLDRIAELKSLFTDLVRDIKSKLYTGQFLQTEYQRVNQLIRVEKGIGVPSYFSTKDGSTFNAEIPAFVNLHFQQPNPVDAYIKDAESNNAIIPKGRALIASIRS